MAMNDPLANALSNILNAEKVGKKECLVRPSSKVILEVLKILKKRGYIEDFKEIRDNKGSQIHVKLIEKINKCLAIKPRYPVSLEDYKKFEKRFLPGVNYGVLIVSTNKGMLDHLEAKEKKLGGKLIAYCY